MTAWISGFLGLAATLGIGIEVLGLSPLESLRCFLVSLVAGFFSLMIILRLERIRALKRRVLATISRVWIVFLFLYFGPLILLAPPLQNWRGFAWLIFPLILSTGFAILAFGPIQDRLVARRQRLQKLRDS